VRLLPTTGNSPLGLTLRHSVGFSCVVANANWQSPNYGTAFQKSLMALGGKHFSALPDLLAKARLLWILFSAVTEGMLPCQAANSCLSAYRHSALASMWPWRPAGPLLAVRPGVAPATRGKGWTTMHWRFFPNIVGKTRLRTMRSTILLNTKFLNG
jgi:hypothetical protein